MIIIHKKYTEFLSQLNDEEREVLKKIRWKWNGFYNDLPKNIASIEAVYDKWEKCFFTKSNYREINKFQLGLLIRVIREQHHESWAAVASAAGCTYAKLNHIEMDHTLPTLEFLFRFSQMFGCSIDKLLKLSNWLF